MATDNWSKVAWGTGAAAVTAAALALPGLWAGDAEARALAKLEPRLRALETATVTWDAGLEAKLLRRQIDAGAELQRALETISVRLGAIERRLDLLDLRFPRAAPPR